MTEYLQVTGMYLCFSNEEVNIKAKEGLIILVCRGPSYS